jgi:hypothetical protein
MKRYYTIEYWNKLFNIWIKHNHIKYKNLQAAKKEIGLYKENKVGIKFRLTETSIVK